MNTRGHKHKIHLIQGNHNCITYLLALLTLSCLQTSIEFAEQQKLCNFALTSVKFGTQAGNADTKANLDKVQKRMLELESVRGCEIICQFILL